MKKYCVFDLDGTLVDSMPQWAEKMLHILREDNIEYPDDIIQTITPLGDLATIELFKQMGVKGSTQEILSRMNDYALRAYSQEIVTKAGIPRLLKSLKQNGHVLAVLTASPNDLATICLKKNEIYDLFDIVWSVNDFSLVKSDTRIYCEAAKRLGAELCEITFFDDNLTAIKTAKAAGLECYAVYDELSKQNRKELERVADKYIVSFESLL